MRKADIHATLLDRVVMLARGQRRFRFPPHGSPDLRHPEEHRDAKGAPLLRRTADQDPLRGPAGARGLARRAPPLRAEVRRAGAGRPRVAPVRRSRARRRPPERRPLAREARRGAAAPPDAARPPSAAAHRRRRRGRPGGSGPAGDPARHLRPRRRVRRHAASSATSRSPWPEASGGASSAATARARPRCSASSPARPSRPPAPSPARAGLRYSVMEQHRDFGGAATVWEAAAGRVRRAARARALAGRAGHGARRGGRPLHAADAGPVRPRSRALRSRGRLHPRRAHRRRARRPRLRSRRGAHPAAGRA